MAPNFPGQSLWLCGHASQVAACGSHSAGMRYPSSTGVCDGLLGITNESIWASTKSLIYKAMGNRAVAINAAIAQEGPIAPDLFHRLQINLADQYLFFIVQAFGQHLSKGIAQERSAPEFQSGAGRRLAAHISVLMTHAIYHCHIHTVSDGMGALNGSPGIMLASAVLRFFRRMPADGRGIEQYLRPLQRGEARAFWIPLVPTYQRPHPPKFRVEGLKAKIAGRKIIFLVIKRIVGNVHLAIHPFELAVGVD